MSKKPNRYSQIIETIFEKHYKARATEIPFSRSDILQAAQELGISLPSRVFSFSSAC